MHIVIDQSSAVPPFEQLREQVIAQVSSGDLAAETKLPTVRKLAADLGIAPNTVAKAYRELESAGIVETRGRNGTFVSTHGDPAHRAAQRAAADYASSIRRLGIPTDEAISLVTAVLTER
ncbi:GntR family transcriptional regulator [Lysinibacter cavernae]|uniref:DNA-binding transcriptional regulator YhcF (GntR family) n=1 Tax=Lysinibacter cavernae TaxID=1640652 RepID=A0A7X5R2F7_9MICO|nr:DNA-binding transcriptional regulator YhcF (GntR family) [Lysinibacter cavernae]